MTRKTLLALLAAQLVAAAALGQSSGPSPAEFGRAHGGEIEAVTKHGRTFSGSLALSQTGNGRGQGYEATLGGSLLDDRLWFFGSASIVPGMQFNPAMNGGTGVTAGGLKLTAQPLDWMDVSASYSDSRTGAANLPAALPSSFLSLRSTSVLSPNAMFTISVSRSSTTLPNGF